MKKLFYKIFPKDTYTFPVLKIIICVALWPAVWFRDIFYSLDKEPLTVKQILFICLYMSGAFLLGAILEIKDIYKKRHKKVKPAKRKSKTRELSIADIIKLSRENDIIEIKAIINNEYILLGSSSECKTIGYEFYNKIYYIEEKEFETIEAFECELNVLLPDRSIEVVKIDGVSPEKYKI
ncbi:MAG: hypothetical protein IKU42_05080 [Oscillospiraceae bacterium]|nr:hypothetical protein [Oscillospiraceae bacterium]